MNAKLVIVADSGRMKAYRLDARPEFSRPRLTLIEDWETNVARHLSEEVTDQAGQFRKAPHVVGAHSAGEEHNLDLERRRRAVRTLARHIEQLIDREHAEVCYLAADNRINQPILDEVNRSARAKIQKNVAANLSKLRPEELIEQFCR